MRMLESDRYLSWSSPDAPWSPECPQVEAELGAALGVAQLGDVAGAGAAAGAAIGAAGFAGAAFFGALFFAAAFFGAAAFDLPADFFADFFAFFADFFDDFLADFFADFFFAATTFFFLAFFDFFFLPLAIVVLLLPLIHIHQAFQVFRFSAGPQINLSSILAADRLSPSREALSCEPQGPTFHRPSVQSQSAPCIRYCRRRSRPA